MFRNTHRADMISSASGSLIKQFKKADLSDYPNVTNYDSDLDAGLWVLWVYQEKLGYDTYLKANEIAEILTSLGISTKEIEITNAFKRAKKKIDRQDVGGKKVYKIMHEGVEYLKRLKGDKNIEVYYVEGNKPRTDRTMLNEVVSKAKGEIKIVDKFYSRESLTLLETFAEKSKIKWLTSVLSRGEDEKKFQTDLSLFRSQYKNVEIKKYAKEYELHDRYIISDDALIFLGHGLKDIGRKESFVLVFKDDVGKDIRATLGTKFEEKWQKSSNL